MKIPTFNKWLKGQAHRQDPIGHLAQDALYDSTWPQRGGLAVYERYLKAYFAPPGASEALRQAWAEHQAVIAAGTCDNQVTTAELREADSPDKLLELAGEKKINPLSTLLPGDKWRLVDIAEELEQTGSAFDGKVRPPDPDKVARMLRALADRL